MVVFGVIIVGLGAFAAYKALNPAEKETDIVMTTRTMEMIQKTKMMKETTIIQEIITILQLLKVEFC